MTKLINPLLTFNILFHKLNGVPKALGALLTSPKNKDNKIAKNKIRIYAIFLKFVFCLNLFNGSKIFVKIKLQKSRVSYYNDFKIIKQILLPFKTI